ncbi:MAG: zinc finger Ran-binding domain-containing protein [Gemmatimonadales bacterium]
MAKTKTESGDAIEQLIEQRDQYVAWLEKLDGEGATAPESVRARVRKDYQARLDEVMDGLRSHSDEVAEQLVRHRDTQAGLATRQAHAEEVLAEAELRHSVGEYDEGRWQEVKGEADRNLEGIREELEGVTSEVERLEFIQGQIAGGEVQPIEELVVPEIPEPVEEEVSPGLPEAVVTEEAPPEPESEPETEPALPEAGRSSGPTPWQPGRPSGESEVDELAFLKSVTEDDMSPAPRRPSGGAQRPAEEAARPGTATARTLKCGECGTMNRPTEWYCERCGAELADL